MEGNTFELRDFNQILGGDLNTKITNHPRAWNREQQVEHQLQESYIDIEEPEDTRIFISEPEDLPITPEVAAETLGETTPLLSGGGTSTILGSAVGGLSSSAAFIPGGALIAAGVGYGAYKGLTVPGHEYLGPGTDLKTAKDPVDEDDKIAKEHDQLYAKAKSNLDIVDADNLAIHKFNKDWEEHGNIHSKVSGILLSGKQAAEQVFGPIYPQV